MSEIFKNNASVLICGLQPRVKEMFDKAGITDLIGEDLFFWDVIEAFKYLDIIQTEKSA